MKAAFKSSALVLLSAFALTACGGSGEEADSDIGEVMAEQQVAIAADGECGPEKLMANLGELNRLAREIPASDPRFADANVAGEILQDELAAADRKDNGMTPEEAMQSMCDSYEKFFAAIEAAG